MAFDAVFNHAIQRACDFVDCAHLLDVAEQAERRANFYLIETLPLCCKQLLASARADPRYVVLVAYEYARLHLATSGFFHDGIGRALTLFTGPSPVSLQPAALRHLSFREVLEDRSSTATRLEALQPRDVERLFAEHRLDDLPERMPARLHIFVSRLRAVAQGLGAVKPATAFATCKNLCCARRFLVNPQGVEACGVGRLAEPTYWALVGASEATTSPSKSFCAEACHREWTRQMERALPPDSMTFLEPDKHCRNTGRARVAEALRACVKRNEEASRKLRAIDKSRYRFPSVDRRQLASQRMNRVRMLNVDLGLIYAASVIAESKTLSVGKVLAASSEGWRSRPRFYASAIRKVQALYDKHHRGEHVTISNVLAHWPFLAKLREKAAIIF